MSKRALAIVRGANLNKFQMQTYELLADKYDITAYSTYNHHFNLDDIHVPVKRLHCLDEFTDRLPWPFRGLLFATYISGFNHYMVGLEKELRDSDIVHVEETFNGYSYQAIRAKDQYGFKVVVTEWENIPFRLACTLPDSKSTDLIPHSLLDNPRLRNEVRQKADLFIAVTERAKHALILDGTAKDKIQVLPMGIDLTIFKPEVKSREMLSSLGLSEDDFVILFIGRLCREKGVYDLIYAAKMLMNDDELKSKRIKFLLVGTGPEKKRLHDTIQTLQLSQNVMLVGSYPYNKMPQLHNLADIFILPSIPVRWWQEQFGMVLIEAFASGVPVISTMSGSIPEVVGDAGILVQPNDPLSLYQSIKGLVQDKQLREELKAKGRQHALDKFDAIKIARQLDELYQGI